MPSREELARVLMETAKEALVRDGRLNSVLIAMSPTREHVFAGWEPGMIPEDFMRLLFRYLGITRYITTSEAWAVEVGPNEKHTFRGTPAEDDRRIEVIVITLFDQHGFCILQQKIDRAPDATPVFLSDPTVVESEWNGDIKMEGRFQHYLPREEDGPLTQEERETIEAVILKHGM